MCNPKKIRMCRHMSVGTQIKTIVCDTLKPPVKPPLRGHPSLSKNIDKNIIHQNSIKIKQDHHIVFANNVTKRVKIP